MSARIGLPAQNNICLDHPEIQGVISMEANLWQQI